jgi:hypothetical protein
MNTYIKLKNTDGKILLLVLATILSIISMYNYAFKGKIYGKPLIVMKNVVLELLGNIPYVTYQFNVGNPPVDFGVKDHEGFITYHWKLTNTQNLSPISLGELSTSTISRNALASVAIEIYVLHVGKPFIILAALSFPSLLVSHVLLPTYVKANE